MCVFLIYWPDFHTKASNKSSPVLVQVVPPVVHRRLVDVAHRGDVAVLDLLLHVQLGGEQPPQYLPVLLAEVVVAARVELPEEHVHHGPVVVHAELFKEGTADLEFFELLYNK